LRYHRGKSTFESHCRRHFTAAGKGAMKKVLIASVLAAVALFFWGAIYWMPIGMAVGIYKPAPNEAALGQALKEQLGTADGFYFLPTDVSDEAAHKARHEAGPIAFIAYHAAGAPIMNPNTFVFGFLHELASTFLMALLLSWLAPRLASYGERVKLVAAAGFVTAFFGNLGRPIWMMQPWSFHVFQFVYEITCWLLVGAILAWFINGSEK
jgi:hypothetical protein